MTLPPVIDNIRVIKNTENFVARRTSGQFESIFQKSNKGFLFQKSPFFLFYLNIAIDK